MPVDPRRHRGREQHGLPVRRGLARGSPRCPRRSPCRASRRPRRARRPRARSRSRVPRPRWSSARPGVATTTSTPRSQRAQLPADRLAAVDRQHPGPEVAAVPVHRLGHLHGQLAGRHEHERARRAPSPPRVGRQPLQQRQRERGRLAGAGRRLAEQVAALEQRRDRLALDRRGLLVAEAGEGAQQLGPQPEVGEAAGVVGRVGDHARFPHSGLVMRAAGHGMPGRRKDIYHSAPAPVVRPRPGRAGVPGRGPCGPGGRRPFRPPDGPRPLAPPSPPRHRATPVSCRRMPTP